MLDGHRQYSTAADRIRLPMTFAPEPLAIDLARLSAPQWIDHLVQQNYDGTWEVLPLRMAAGATHPVMMIYADPTATEFVDAPALAHCPAFQAVLAAFHCPLQTARLMLLTPGSTIREHRDHDLSVEQGMARIHVPVTTNRHVDFRLNGKRVDMAVGEAWYLRLADRHSVANDGTTDRVHLVIDCEVNDWLAALLDDAQPCGTIRPISTIAGSIG
ncbi:aspartyl/asparaginyl beta-hydroxylase domain-containing protein [Sphingomonas sp. PP-CC-3G-468]|uniref:aspartyl/asparaginyl beta-hydroxylase domain-containing protein n=1 Tax=Sphingomonas sp. PP-CC-3G-468 TaxID=2135656 RepID=UPI0010503AF9|nr:aspartyl/asparaginyl beta-hydroxylase domain-containing protein [Sphingomonas sp. PP-CC-3G-468]TCM07484.1 aspartyl/asparaginyl beta-hydroxylase [Sphingomonas sp. PP-CC-3G-468]